MHISYEKIEENFSNSGLTKEDYKLFKKVDWVVTEKIHGANFCIIINKCEFQYAKRKEIIEPDDEFFGYKAAIEKIKYQFTDIDRLIKKDFKNVETTFIYGELFGGGYPHPEVEPDSTVHLIQTGVYYSPKIEFCIFDIGIKETNGERKYLDYKLLERLCNHTSLLYAKPLYKGNYENALQINIRYESKIPFYFNLPKLPFSNLAEGVVVKPFEEIQFSNPSFRPILKIKIEEFSEIQFHQSEQWSSFEPKGKLTLLTRDILSIVNKNRLMNAVSKIGKIKTGDRKQIQQLEQYLAEDIKTEIEKKFLKSFYKLNIGEREQINRILKSAIEELIKDFLKN